MHRVLEVGWMALMLSSCSLFIRQPEAKNKTVCPEYRNMHCMTAPECSFDQTRGCFVCQCSPAGNDNGTLPSGMVPDRRL
jgi:hypothetical protein